MRSFAFTKNAKIVRNWDVQYNTEESAKLKAKDLFHNLTSSPACCSTQKYLFKQNIPSLEINPLYPLRDILKCCMPIYPMGTC